MTITGPRSRARSRALCGTLLAIVAAIGVATPGSRGAEAWPAVRPGAKAQSAEERAIQADPEHGIEHSVILLDETNRDDAAAKPRLEFHRRVKVLSADARSLGQIRLPLATESDILIDFWAHSIQPDGTVRSLERSALVDQKVEEWQTGELRVRKGLVPGVEIGSVIDYGWTIQRRWVVDLETFDIQQNAPVRLFRLRWKPLNSAASYVPSRKMLTSISVTAVTGGVQVTGHDLPPRLEEPQAPPAFELFSSITFIYFPSGADPSNYWDAEAKRIEKDLTLEIRHPATMRAILAAAGQANAEPGAEEALRDAYDWIVRNIRNARWPRDADREAVAAWEVRSDDIDRVAKERIGSPTQIVRLFVGVARVLGYEAHEVRATDRTKRYWDPRMRSLQQFSLTFAAVRRPGQSDDEYVVLAPSLGLPWGELPWWTTGTRGFLASGKGAVQVTLVPGAARSNTARTDGWCEWSLLEERRCSWNTVIEGARGQDLGRRLREAPPAEWEKIVEPACGGGWEYTLSKVAEASVTDPLAPLRIECAGSVSIQMDQTEGEPLAQALATQTRGVSLRWIGPWQGHVPDLFPGPRQFAVVWDAPRTEQTNMEVRSPEGFVPDTALPPILLETPVGSYSRVVEIIPAGFVVSRKLVFPRLLVEPADYPALAGFLEAVRAADRSLLQFRRADTGEPQESSP